MTKTKSKLQRYRYFIKVLLEKYKVYCHFCGKRITYERDFSPKEVGRKRDRVTWHHLDLNRRHNCESNLVLCHRSCHRKYHKRRKSEG